MTRSEARSAVRTATDHDFDDQASATQIDDWVDLEYRLVRRELAAVAPQFYLTVDTPQTLTGSSVTLTSPSRMDRLIRLEKLSGSTYHPVEPSDELGPSLDLNLNFREEGATLVVAPVSKAPGTYRVVYVTAPAVMPAAGGSRDSDALLVPAGLEDVIVQRVAARIADRLNDDSAPFLNRAAAVWTLHKRLLRKRYGNHPRPGLRRNRSW